MEWTLGITDIPPRHWKASMEWDERHVATSGQTFRDLISDLCGSALRSRRGSDSRITAHMWDLKIFPNQKSHRTGFGYVSVTDTGGPSSDLILLGNPPRKISADEKIDESLLSKEMVVHFTYDYGSTSNLYLKVMDVAPIGTNQKMDANANEADTRDIEAVPAFHLPTEKRIDAVFPNFSRAFLGRYVPLFEETKENQNLNKFYGTHNAECVMRSSSLGLSSRIRSEQDTVFSTIENSTGTQDVFFAGEPFTDLDEFLLVAERAWSPRDRTNDPDRVENFRYECISRFVFPAGPEGDVPYDRCTMDLGEGNGFLFSRLTNEEKSDKPSFRFAEVFPKTHSNLTSGKFRWIKYSKGVLRILVGRGKDRDGRGFARHQVLRKWDRKFESLHELLCAVEASWVYDGSELLADTVIKDVDDDLSPSDPGPTEPESFGKKTDCVVISKSNDFTKKFVTALQVVIEHDNKPVLYSGHNDGTLVKWDLTSNEVIWRKQVYADESDESVVISEHIGVQRSEVLGVSGISVHRSELVDHVYVWSDKHQPGKPALITCLSGKNGNVVRTFACDVGLDEDGRRTDPSVSCVVFCLLRNQVTLKWEDTMIVGLHCTTAVLDFRADYEDFDWHKAARACEGNILPFRLDGSPLETWRGHMGMIQSLAVLEENEYLVSLSICRGHGFPDALILWDLCTPGVPLARLDFWKNPSCWCGRMTHRIMEVVGIAAYGTKVLLASVHGDQIASVSVDHDSYGKPSLRVRGYGNVGNIATYSAFHGGMAMGGRLGAMFNESATDVWLFNIDETSSHEKLDTRDGDPRDFCDDLTDGCAEEDDTFAHRGRDVAVGHVAFPEHGGNPPKTKKRKGSPDMWSFDDDADDTRHGAGGPTAVSWNGKFLVAGFANGTIVRAPFLPEPISKHAAARPNTLVSSSYLPSDQGHCPPLDYEGDDDDDDDDGPHDRSDCCIQ